MVGPRSFIYRIIHYIPTEFLMGHPYRLAVLFLQYPKGRSGLRPMEATPGGLIQLSIRKGMLHKAGGVVKC